MDTVRALYKEACEKVSKPVVDYKLKCFFKRLLKSSDHKPAVLDHKGSCIAIIADLNSRIGTNYRDVAPTRARIYALLNRGFTVEDFKKVNEVKSSQWLSDDKMRPYLRPSTLYQASKFEGYLEEWEYANRKRKRDRVVTGERVERRRSWNEFKTFSGMYRYYNTLPPGETEGFKEKMPFEIREMVENYVKYWVGNRIDEANSVYREAKGRG